MRYVVSLLFGLALGAIVAVAGIFFNPLTLNQSTPPDDAEWVLNYSLDAEETWLSTHENQLGVPIVPTDVPLLYENGIRGSLMAAMPLKGEPGSASGAGTRISIPSSNSELLKAGVMVEDHWLISVPGSGTLLVHAESNHWPMLRDTLIRVDLLKRNWKGPGQYDPTLGPSDGGAEVIGLTGSYRDFHGVGHERISLASYAGSLDPLAGQLLIQSE